MKKTVHEEKYAIVTDAFTRKSMSVIRSIGKQGYKVIALGDSIFAMGFWSSYCHKHYICKSAAENKDEFGQLLLTLLDNLKPNKPVIFPMEDASLIWCCENIDIIKDKGCILSPPLDSLMLAENKAKTLKIAQEIGIPCPKTFFPYSKEEFIENINTMGSDDFVVKPVTSSGSLGLVYGNTLNIDGWGKYWDQYGPAVIQERLDEKGAGIGVSILMDDKCNCIINFAHRRIHQYPISGGAGTNRISIVYPELAEQSFKLLKHLSWTGVAMVEWKVDVNTNIPKLMEINPRFWGSLELAVRSGADFPALYAMLARNEKAAPVSDYIVGKKCRWLFPGDILRYMSEKKRKKKTETIAQFLKGLPKEAEEWDQADLKGFFACILCQALLALNPKYWKYLRR